MAFITVMSYLSTFPTFASTLVFRYILGIISPFIVVSFLIIFFKGLSSFLNLLYFVDFLFASPNFLLCFLFL